MMWQQWKFVKDSKKMPEQPTIYIGCMTGTSADSVADFTLAVFDEEGFPIAHRNVTDTIPEALRLALQRLSKQEASVITIKERSIAEEKLTDYLVDAYQRVIAKAELARYPKQKIILSPHGQTINHQPTAIPPYLDVLLNPEALAIKTGYAVVARHRVGALVKSMAAPLAPVLIRQLFFDPNANTVLLNGGGIANIAVLLKDQPNEIIGFDTGPANAPMDALVQHFDGTMPYDLDGQYAAAGIVIPELLEKLLSHEYFQRDSKQKSADRAMFDLEWVRQAAGEIRNWKDALATVAEAVARSVAKAIVQAIPDEQLQASNRIMVYGGMAHNKQVMKSIKMLLEKAGQFQFVDMHSLNYDPDFFESLLMAYLGHCVVENKTMDLSYCKRVGVESARVVPGTLFCPSPNCREIC